MASEDEHHEGILRVGIAGLGRAGVALIPALRRHPNIELVAAARPDRLGLDEFARDFHAETYSTVDELCASPSVDAVYIATPTELHAAHAIIAAQAGKHILLEKPMAASMEQARAIVKAAEQHNVVLLVGHSHSYDPPVRAIREIIESGRLGNVRMINNWYYSDWWYRPRRPDELDSARGGGVTLRQGAHQFDIIRYLGGGEVRSIRAATGSWDTSRPGPGSHAAFVEFTNGIVATAVYSGYDHFPSSELTFAVTESGALAPSDTYAKARSRLVEATRGAGEDDLKRAAGYPAPISQFEGFEHQPFFGLTVVSCERGDIRQSPDGILIYDDRRRQEIEVSKVQTPRDIVVAELYDAVVRRTPPVHDGRWGLATLELCVAAVESARTRGEVFVSEQVPLRR